MGRNLTWYGPDPKLSELRERADYIKWLVKRSA